MIDYRSGDSPLTIETGSDFQIGVKLLQSFIDGLGKVRADVESSPPRARIVTGRAGKVPVFWGNDFLYAASYVVELD
jgi:hypothetical protein